MDRIVVAERRPRGKRRISGMLVVGRGEETKVSDGEEEWGPVRITRNARSRFVGRSVGRSIGDGLTMKG